MFRFFSFLFLFVALAAMFSVPSCKCNQDSNSVDANDSLVAPHLKDPQVKAITDKIRQDPKNAELFFERSVTFHQMSLTAPAYADIQRAISIDSNNVRYRFHAADIMLSDGYAEGAIREFQKVLSLQPDSWDARLRLAKTYLYAADHQNALVEVRKLIEQDRTHFEPYFIAGLSYKELGDTTAAIQNFQNALQYKPEFYDAYMQLGLLTSKKKTPEAPQYFDNAIRLDSTSAEAWYAKGKYFQDQKQYEEAKKIYRKLIQVSPQNDDAFFNLGFILILQDSIEKAHRHFDFAVRVKPTRADSYYYRGLCAYELGDVAKARADLSQCLALDPENELAQDLLNTLNKQANP